MPTILIVEDDLDVADMLNAYFRIQGYEVITVNWGEDALRSCEETLPDLVILDIRLPDIDGFEVATRLRAKRRTKDVPILFLTDRGSRENRLRGLEVGGDDYITKPFDIQELRLRVRNTLSRAHQSGHRNPVTNLPEGRLLDERLRAMLSSDRWAVLMISMENLHVFREEYGFIAADDVMRASSLMVANTVSHMGAPEDFLGHLSPERLIFITSPDLVSKLEKRAVNRLHQSLDYFYPMRDRESDTGRLKSIYLNKLSVWGKAFTHKDSSFPDINALKKYLLDMKKP
jgi:DNA-binding response OmpR family regulator